MRIAILASVILVGCAHASTPPPAARPATLGPDEMVALCEHLHREAAQCPKEFIELNIDLRIKYSPEFAEKMKDPEIRRQATEAGIAETAADAANAHERCLEFAKPDWGPPAPRGDVAVLDGCYAKAACADKMACMGPVIEPRFKYRAEHHASH